MTSVKLDPHRATYRPLPDPSNPTPGRTDAHDRSGLERNQALQFPQRAGKDGGKGESEEPAAAGNEQSLDVPVPVAFLGKGRLVEDAVVLAQIAAESRARTTADPDIRREAYRALWLLVDSANQVAKQLTPRQRSEVETIVDYLRQAIEEDRIGVFSAVVRGPRSYVLGIIAGNHIALADSFLTFGGSLYHGAAEVLLRAAHRILYGARPGALRRADWLADKLVADDRVFWDPKLQRYPEELRTLQQVHQEALRYREDHPESIWIQIAGYVFLSDPESARALQEWFDVEDPSLWGDRRFMFEHRFIDEVTTLHVYPDTVLRLTVRNEGRVIRFVIDDVHHPQEIRLEAVHKYDQDDKAGWPGDEALADVLRLLDNEWDVPQEAQVSEEAESTALVPSEAGRIADASHPDVVVVEKGPVTVVSASSGFLSRAGGFRISGVKLGPPAPPEQNPRVQYHGLYGRVVRYGDLMRPELIYLPVSGRTLYIEPEISEWYWVHDREFANAYFAFIEQLAQTHEGLVLASLGNPMNYAYHAQEDPDEELFTWGMVDQHELEPENYARWSENLSVHRERMFELHIPVHIFRDARIRQLALEMAAEGFLQLSPAGFRHKTYPLSVEQVLAAFERARNIKRQHEQQRSTSLRGYIRQGPGVIFMERRGRDLSKLYLELRTLEGRLVHFEVLDKAEVKLRSLPRPKPIRDEQPFRIAGPATPLLEAGDDQPNTKETPPPDPHRATYRPMPNSETDPEVLLGHRTEAHDRSGLNHDVAPDLTQWAGLDGGERDPAAAGPADQDLQRIIAQQSEWGRWWEDPDANPQLPREYLDWLISQLRRLTSLSKLRRVIDVGAGEGMRALDLHEKLFEGGWKEDADEDSVRVLRMDSAADLAPVWGGEHVRAMAEHIPARGSSFDLAMVSLVLDYLTPPQRAAALREVGRILRPGGFAALFFHDPKSEHSQNLDADLRELFPATLQSFRPLKRSEIQQLIAGQKDLELLRLQLVRGPESGWGSLSGDLVDRVYGVILRKRQRSQSKKRIAPKGDARPRRGQPPRGPIAGGSGENGDVSQEDTSAKEDAQKVSPSETSPRGAAAGQEKSGQVVEGEGKEGQSPTLASTIFKRLSNAVRSVRSSRNPVLRRLRSSLAPARQPLKPSTSLRMSATPSATTRISLRRDSTRAPTSVAENVSLAERFLVGMRWILRWLGRPVNVVYALHEDGPGSEDAGHPPAAAGTDVAGRRRKAIFRAWQQLARVGTLDEIRAMDRFEFAHRLGARWIHGDILTEPVYLTDVGWQNMRAVRRARKHETSEDREYLEQHARPGTELWRWIMLSNIPSITGPDIYYDMGTMVGMERAAKWRYGKPSFAHELFEKKTAEAGAQTADAPPHAAFEVLEAEVQFAALLGGEELQNTLTMRRENVEALTEAIQALEAASGAPDQPIVPAEVERSLRRLKELLERSVRPEFLQEAQRLWEQAGRTTIRERWEALVAPIGLAGKIGRVIELDVKRIDSSETHPYQFLVQAELGGAGFSRVYLVRDVQHDGSHYVLKVFSTRGLHRLIRDTQYFLAFRDRFGPQAYEEVVRHLLYNAEFAQLIARSLGKDQLELIDRTQYAWVPEEQSWTILMEAWGLREPRLRLTTGEDSEEVREQFDVMRRLSGILIEAGAGNLVPQIVIDDREPPRTAWFSLPNLLRNTQHRGATPADRLLWVDLERQIAALPGGWVVPFFRFRRQFASASRQAEAMGLGSDSFHMMNMDAFEAFLRQHDELLTDEIKRRVVERQIEQYRALSARYAQRLPRSWNPLVILAKVRENTIGLWEHRDGKLTAEEADRLRRSWRAYATSVLSQVPGDILRAADDIFRTVLRLAGKVTMAGLMTVRHGLGLVRNTVWYVASSAYREAVSRDFFFSDIESAARQRLITEDEAESLELLYSEYESLPRYAHLYGLYLAPKLLEYLALAFGVGWLLAGQGWLMLVAATAASSVYRLAVTWVFARAHPETDFGLALWLGAIPLVGSYLAMPLQMLAQTPKVRPWFILKIRLQVRWLVQRVPGFGQPGGLLQYYADRYLADGIIRIVDWLAAIPKSNPPAGGGGEAEHAIWPDDPTDSNGNPMGAGFSFGREADPGPGADPKPAPAAAGDPLGGAPDYNEVHRLGEALRTARQHAGYLGDLRTHLGGSKLDGPALEEAFARWYTGNIDAQRQTFTLYRTVDQVNDMFGLLGRLTGQLTHDLKPRGRRGWRWTFPDPIRHFVALLKRLIARVEESVNPSPSFFEIPQEWMGRLPQAWLKLLEEADRAQRQGENIREIVAGFAGDLAGELPGVPNTPVLWWSADPQALWPKGRYRITAEFGLNEAWRTGWLDESGQWQGNLMKFAIEEWVTLGVVPKSRIIEILDTRTGKVLYSRKPKPIDSVGNESQVWVSETHVKQSNTDRDAQAGEAFVNEAERWAGEATNPHLTRAQAREALIRIMEFADVFLAKNMEHWMRSPRYTERNI